jgi:hypothetical protein
MLENGEVTSFNCQRFSKLITLTSQRGDNDIDFFIAVLSVFLTPIYFNSENEKKDYILLEDDYQALWEQFPIIQFVNYLFKYSKETTVNQFQINLCSIQDLQNGRFLSMQWRL